jgi:Tol biopolymer transport system component
MAEPTIEVDNLRTASEDVIDEGSGQANKTEPPEAVKDEGEKYGDEPPVNWMNYWKNLAWQWLQHIVDDVMKGVYVFTGKKTFTDTSTSPNEVVIEDGSVAIDVDLHVGGDATFDNQIQYPKNDVIDDDATLEVNKDYFITGAGVNASLPATANVGDAIGVFTDKASRILQVDAENVIGYKNSKFTTKGLDGYLQLKNQDSAKLVYKGAGGSIIVPGTLITGQALATYVSGYTWSPDGKYLAASTGALQYIYVFINNNDDTFTSVGVIASPDGAAKGIAFSPDGQYLALAHDGTPFCTMYKNNNDNTFTELGVLTALDGIGNGVSWSPDGQYVAFAHDGSPYATIFKNNGDDTFTKVAALTALDGTGYGCAWSPDGQYVAFAHGTTPYATIFKNNGDDTFTKVAALDALDGLGTGVSWSPDGLYVAFAHDGSPYATIFKNNEDDTFTKVAALEALELSGYACAWSPDGQYVAFAHDGSPYATIFKNNGDDTFTKVAALTALNGIGSAVAWSPDGKYTVFGCSDGSGELQFYKNFVAATKMWLIENLNTQFETDKDFMFK